MCQDNNDCKQYELLHNLLGRLAIAESRIARLESLSRQRVTNVLCKCHVDRESKDEAIDSLRGGANGRMPSTNNGT